VVTLVAVLVTLEAVVVLEFVSVVQKPQCLSHIPP
jgi:hypothetical protein